MSMKNGSISDPVRKISETFRAFVAPLLDVAGGKATQEQSEEILRIGFTVWNSVVFDTVNDNSHYVSIIRQLTSSDPGSAMLVEMMITRKNTMFPDDQRLIGEYKLTKKPGKWHLWAEAREPKRTV